MHRGKWGVGKTHTWKAGLAAAKAKDAVGLNSYAYVSNVRNQRARRTQVRRISRTRCPKRTSASSPSIETFQNNTVAVTKQAGARKVLDPLLKLPVYEQVRPGKLRR